MTSSDRGTAISRSKKDDKICVIIIYEFSPGITGLFDAVEA
jgi:hypothetical protein